MKKKKETKKEDSQKGDSMHARIYQLNHKHE